MSLLDSNVKTIIGKEPKHHWKDSLRGIEQSWDLKDQQGNLLGKFKPDDKKSNEYILYNLDDSILIKLHFLGVFKRGIEISDSKNHLLAKIRIKGLWTERIQLENSNGEKILECKTAFNCPIIDRNEKTIAELKTKRFKNDWLLNILEPNFDKKLIIGFSLALLMKLKSGSGFGNDAGG